MRRGLGGKAVVLQDFAAIDGKLKRIGASC